MTTYSDATTSRTPAQVLEDVSEEIEARGGDDKSFTEQSTQYQTLRSYSEARSSEESIRADVVRGGYLDTVEQIAEENGRDQWIDQLSIGNFNLPRDPSSKALHVFRLTNDVNGVLRDFSPLQLRARFGNVDFLNVSRADVDEYGGSGKVSPGDTLDLLFEAQTPGTIGNIPVNQLTQLVTVFAGVSVSNPPIPTTSSSIYRAARDAERNASLLDRDRARWGATSAGGSNGSIVEWIHEAFAFAAVKNTVTKWYIDDANPDGPNTVRVYLANDSGPATAEEIAIVQPYLSKRRHAGSNSSDINPGILVLPAVEKPVSFTATLKNSTNPTVLTDAAAVVASLNATTQLGQYTLYRNEVIEQLMGIAGMVDITFIDFANTFLDSGENLVLSATFTKAA